MRHLEEFGIGGFDPDFVTCTRRRICRYGDTDCTRGISAGYSNRTNDRGIAEAAIGVAQDGIECTVSKIPIGRITHSTRCTICCIYAERVWRYSTNADACAVAGKAVRTAVARTSCC